MFKTRLFLPFLVSILIMVSSLLLNSCATEGCTDSKANNFSYEANKDNGSCDYGGCTDPNSLNFNPDAQYDNGTCKYNGGVHVITNRSGVAQNNIALIVHVNGRYIGALQSICTNPFPTCSTNCDQLSFTEKTSGTYILRYWEVEYVSSTQMDTIYESQSIPFQVTGGECNTFMIE